MTKPRSVANTANDNSIPGSKIVDNSIGLSKLDIGALSAGSVAFTQDSSSTQRSVQAKLEESVSVKDFGATGSGNLNSDLVAFQSALASGVPVFVPRGTYILNDTLELTNNQHLILDAEVEIRSSVSPVLWFHGLNSSIRGEGSTSVIRCTGASSYGVILVGSKLTTDSTNCFYNDISSIKIQGNDGFGAANAFTSDYTVGLMVRSSEGWTSNQAVYYNRYHNLVIQDNKDGIAFIGLINANFVDKVLFWRIGHTALNFFNPHSTDGAGQRYGWNWDTQTLNKTGAENIISNIFVDTSFLAYNSTPGYASRTFSDGQQYPAQGTCIRYIGHHVFDSIINFLAEPGAGTSYEIDPDTTRTYIQGSFNVTTGTNNAQFVASGTTIVTNGSGIFNQITASTEALIYRMRVMDTGSVAAPAIYDRYQTGTGLAFPTPGSMTFSSSGQEVLKTSLSGLTIKGGPLWTTGVGSPEGAVTAPVGSLYTRTDGSLGSTLYVKEAGSGNTGWTAK